MEIDYEKTLQNIETLRKLTSKKYHKELSKLEKNENDFYEALGFDMLKRSINHKRKKIEILYYFLNSLEVAIESKRIEKNINVKDDSKLDSILDFIFDFDTDEELETIYDYDVTKDNEEDEDYTLGLDIKWNIILIIKKP